MARRPPSPPAEVASPSPPSRCSAAALRKRVYRAKCAKAADDAALAKARDERRLFNEMNVQADAEIEAMHQAATDEFFSITIP